MRGIELCSLQIEGNTGTDGTEKCSIRCHAPRLLAETVWSHPEELIIVVAGNASTGYSIRDKEMCGRFMWSLEDGTITRGVLPLSLAE